MDARMPQSGYVPVNGQRLYYELHGEGDPLLLISGLAGDVSGFALQIPALAAKFRVIVFDNRDSGRSSQASGPYDVKDMAEDAAGLLDSLGIESAHVCGFSMGGAIALELAIHRPEKIRKMILACTMAQLARFRLFLFEPAVFIKERDPEGIVFVKNQLLWCMTHDFLKNAAAVDQTLAMFLASPYPQSPEAFKRQTSACEHFDVLDRLSGVRTPALVLVGDQDILTPPWAAKEMADALPNATLQILTGGGHGFMWEISEKVNAAISAFLGSP